MKRRAQPWLGTLVEVTLADALRDDAAARAFDAAFAAVAEVHRLMSYHDVASDVARINRMAVGSVIRVDARTATVIRMALHLNAVTDGLFDIGCASKLVEWSYLPESSEKIAGSSSGNAASRINLHIDDADNVRKIAPVLIDLGGIAKGYAVDAAISALQASGIASACVNAGGDLRVFGEHAYPVMIRDPRAPTQIAARIELKNAALATSGSYFSQKTVQGHQRSALVNCESGNALVDNVSATVQAADCMTADALTKLVLLSGDHRHPLLQQFGATAFII
ncbi:FAD:protein FMN transferase [Collimonas antrihumi]|uniref:FAD:protein FMN transferase n=1 Tax=Collimonas antrihumi TaxID=1940615 RepID=UPI001B8C36C9|nr:FAD:protein FMN transferase [Collimonas antrihumi]